MGFFDSLFKSTVRRVVNDVVDNAVNKAFNGNNNTPSYNQPDYQQTFQQQPPQQQQITYGSPVTLSQPDIENVLFTYSLYPVTSDDEVDIEFLKSSKLFLGDSGAVEIPVLFMVADTEDEAYNDDLYNSLPKLYIGTDEFADNPSLKERATNMVISKVENHNYIYEKMEYDFYHNGYGNIKPQTVHTIAYKLYLSNSDKAQNCATVITLEIPYGCTQQRQSDATQALNLLTASFTTK